MSFDSRIVAASQPSAWPWRPAFGRIVPAGAEWLLVAAALLAAAIVEQVWLGLDTDVSWLLTVGERVLAGQRLYVDIFEVNPPASVLIYLPGIAFARALGLKPELVIAALGFALAGASLWSTERILRKARLLLADRRGPFVSFGLVVFVLLAGLCFAQREHFAVLTLLPFLAVQCARMRGRQVGLASLLVAGVGCGITMAIKPHFAMAAALPVLFVTWRRRSLAPALQADVGAAAAVVLAYGLLVAAAYPDYIRALPLLAAVYVPARNNFHEVWLSAPAQLFVVASVACLFVGRSALVRSTAIVPLLAAWGFAAAMAVQGKGYLNHAYPAFALAWVALAVIVSEQPGHRSRRALGAAVLAVLTGASILVFALGPSLDYPEVARVVKRVGPPHPRIMVAGTDLSVGHPLTRWVNGQWVGRRGALWATAGAFGAASVSADPAQRSILQHYADDDRRIFIEDLDHGGPDVVLVPYPAGVEWIAGNADVARAMSRYRSAAVVRDIRVMVRRKGT